jgi:hypothetical protein
MKNQQKGFTVVEGLLLTVILGIIIAVAWYVFHVNVASDNIGDLGKIEKKDTSGSATSGNQDYTATPPSIPAKTVSAKPKYVTKTPVSKNDYITIEDWDVKFKKNGTITIMYAHDSNDNIHRSAFFSSTELTSKNKACKAVFYPAGYIVRYKGNEKFFDEKGNDTNMTAKEHFDTNSKSDKITMKQIGDYYYFYRGPAAKCSELKAIQNLQDQTAEAVKTFLMSLESI